MSGSKPVAQTDTFPYERLDLRKQTTCLDGKRETGTRPQTPYEPAEAVPGRVWGGERGKIRAANSAPKDGPPTKFGRFWL